MSKMSTESTRHALNGPTMGTRWSAVFFSAPGLDVAPIQAALQAAVNEVDAQMSTWQTDSNLMRLNRAPVNTLVEVPAHLAHVLSLGLAIGRASGRAARRPRTSGGRWSNSPEVTQAMATGA